MGRHKRRWTDAELERAITRSCGFVTHAAIRLGMSRSNLYHRISASERLQGVLRDAREEMADLAEHMLRLKVFDGDWLAIQYTLRTLGASRGYSGRREVVGTARGRVRVVESDSSDPTN